ncbi:MAG: hypothetical protein HZB46_01335, partial [Solirubrobacterales bacterium]|nr:hypothetical protein [Solirubrobacterales bacterium]
AALAKALGKSTAEVKAALEKEHAAKEADIAAKLAKQLGISEAKVKAALDKVGGPGKGGPMGGRRAGLDALAKELGVSTTKLHDALHAIRPDRGDHHRGDRDAAVAKALGVTEAELEKAEEAARKAFDPAAERAAMAKELAAKLGIDEAKVKDALGSMPFGGPGGPGGRGRHDRMGPGGPPPGP